MPQMIAEPIEFTIGQTEPVTFKLYTAGRAVVSLTGATVNLSLWSTDDDDELWDFDDTNATTTIASNEISWSPADEDVFAEAQTCLAQLKITWASGKIEYFPKDYHRWEWVIHPRTTDGS